MKIIALSGWGQPHDALREVAPSAVHVDYARTPDVKEALNAIAEHADAEVIVGWSMGGQMAVRAISEGLLRPRKLVLIAAPFSALGSGAATLKQFQENFKRDQDRTLKKSYALITHGDTRIEYIEPYLSEARKRLPQHDWLYWLGALADQAAQEKRLTGFPPTELVHGARDVVVELSESEAYLRQLPSARLHRLDEAGHAPHWHDTARVRALIEGVS